MTSFEKVMTQEEKELLLVDLTARLSYGVICQVDDGAAGLNDGKLVEIDISKELVKFDVDYYWDAYIDDIKPYLRPMSSMTEDESAELSNIISEWFDKELFYLTEEPFLEYALSKINYSINPRLFDWLNKNHFDYRGLIDKGIALEAPNDMYKK